MVVITFLVHELSVIAHFNNLALIHGHNDIAVFHGRQTVRNDKHRPAMFDLLQIGLNNAFGFIVQG